MSLPRPASIFDAPAPRKAARTGMPFSGGPLSVKDEAEAVMEMSDAEFDAWLDEQMPTPDREKWFNDKMLQIWMSLNTAATKAQAEYTQEMLKFAPVPRRPEASDYGPQYRSLPAYEDPYENGISEWYLKELQDHWEAEEKKRQALRQKPLTLVARAERVQTKISLVV